MGGFAPYMASDARRYGRAAGDRPYRRKESFMRKHMREILRRRAERIGVKASRYVAQAWNKHEVRKLGEGQRARNRAHGTKPRRLWAGRG